MRIFRHNQRGDTLIEVLLAMVILGVIIVGAISFMNFGLKNEQMSLEHSEVRAGINSQTALLEYLRDNNMARRVEAAGGSNSVWSDIVANYIKTGTPNTDDTACSVTTVSKGFYLTSNGASSGEIKIQKYNSVTPTTFSTPGQGLWIEAYDLGGTPRAIDFVVRACWPSLGSGPVQQESTVLRLYDAK